MEKGFVYRIYPNKRQRELITKTFGCARFVYNYYLNKKRTLYRETGVSMNFYGCCKDLTSLKNELPWLKEVDSMALQNSLKNLHVAYERFFTSNMGYPKFKTKKTHRHSYRTNCVNNGIRIRNKHIRLPKLGYVKIKGKLIPQGRILNATITQVPSGKYYVSLCCTDVDPIPLPKTNEKIGIDMGIKTFATLSNGDTYENPAYLKKSLDKLVKLQQALSRKTKGSVRYNKARIRLAKVYEHVANQRKDYLNKLSTELIKKYDTICIESLKVKEMMQNHKLAQSISDVSWSAFVCQLKCKAEMYDKQVIKIDTYFPSSQMCSACGYIYPETKDLSVREWICPQCNTHHDRDTNAAINILNQGLTLSIIQ